MFGPSVKAFAVSLLLLSTPALAKKENFLSGSPFGIGFVFGGQKQPSSGFTEQPQTASSSYGTYVALEPYLDFVNFQVRLSGGWHFYSVLHGSGQDSSGNFSDTSSAGSFDYGVKLLLSPWQSPSMDSRAYFILGMGSSIVKAKNTRGYSSGALVATSQSERLEGSGASTNAGVGFEFFLLQNYSMQLEAGYAQVAADSFGYKSSTDFTGATRSDGETAMSGGNKKGFHLWSPYVQVVLNLNL